MKHFTDDGSTTLCGESGVASAGGPVDCPTCLDAWSGRMIEQGVMAALETGPSPCVVTP